MTSQEHLRARLSRMLPEISASSGPEHAGIRSLLDEARASFVRGYQEVLRSPIERLSFATCDELPATRGFALEGAAMAATLLDILSVRQHLGALLDGKNETERILCAIGVGWAGARLGKPGNWLPPELGHLDVSAFADGYGFHQGFFHAKRFKTRGFPTPKGGIHDSFDLGLGRSLWFIHFGTLSPISGIIHGMPEARQKWLWRGVGTACAFTGSIEYCQSSIQDERMPYSTDIHIGLERGALLRNALTDSAKHVVK